MQNDESGTRLAVRFVGLVMKDAGVWFIKRRDGRLGIRDRVSDRTAFRLDDCLAGKHVVRRQWSRVHWR